VGYIDAEGFLFIVDRMKEIIIRGGENISCIEVEAALYQHPAVVEAAVYGVPDERLGEAVAASLVLRDGETLSAEALREFLQEHIAAFKIPAHWRFHAEALPRIATGKIFKRQLKAELSERLSA
jgi:acyl-CoA synthetase (AMP-forming)/AMP-acid ligase II